MAAMKARGRDSRQGPGRLWRKATTRVRSGVGSAAARTRSIGDAISKLRRQLRATKAKGEAKANLDTTWKTLDEQRAAVRRDLIILEKSTAADYEAAKAQVKKSLEDLRKTLNGASSKI